MGRDDDLEPRPLRPHESFPGDRMAAATRAEDGPERLRGHLAVQAELFGDGAAPAEWGLAAGAVVVEGLAGVVVGPAEHVLFVIRHGFGAHDREPSHSAALPSLNTEC